MVARRVPRALVVVYDPMVVEALEKFVADKKPVKLGIKYELAVIGQRWHVGQKVWRDRDN